MEKFESALGSDAAKEKPKFLFHGSTRASLTNLTPGRTQSIGEDGKEKTFASPSREVASVYLASDYIAPLGWSSGRYNGALCVFVPMSEQSFRAKDKGGYLYTVSSEKYELNDGMGMGDEEYRATESVPTETSEYIPSILDEWKKNGIRAFFVEGAELEKAESLHGNERYAYLEQCQALRNGY
jgi:hypothetical protein